MPYAPRIYDTIFNAKANRIKSSSNISDLNVSGGLRTLAEASSKEDEDQYFQMVLLKATFALQNAVGVDLEERVANFDLFRLPAGTSSGFVQIRNDEAITSTVLSFGQVDAFNDFIEFVDSSIFPIAGFPYSVKIAEGTSTEEILNVTANDTVTGKLTVDTAGFSHDSEDVVTQLVNSGNPTTISSGLAIQVPARGGNPAVQLITVDSGTQEDGNVFSSIIPAVSIETGALANVGANQISQFTSGAPYSGAKVFNSVGFSSGRDEDTDDELRERVRDRIQSLTRGTKRTLLTQIIGVEDTNTKQRVVSVRLRNDFVNNETIIYIDDGTGQAAIQNTLPSTKLTATANFGNTTLTVDSIANFPDAGWVLVTPDDPANAELIKYTAVGGVTLTLDSTVQNATGHLIDADVKFVDIIMKSAETGQKYLRTQLFPVVRGTPIIYAEKATGQWKEQVRGTDYEINIATGVVIFLGNGLPTGSQVVAIYSYYSGLVATVQKLVDGDVNNLDQFAGLKAEGVTVIVEPPTIKNIPVQVSIAAAAGFTEGDLVDLVKDAISVYINSRGVGEDVIMAEIVQRVQGVTVGGVESVADTSVISPLSNVIVLEDELPWTTLNDIVVT